MVKVAYITRINFFSNKAHVHTITKTCEALSKTGEINVNLISTDNSLFSDEKKNEFFVLHNVSNKFPVVSLRSFSNSFKNSSNFFIYNIGTIFANISLLKYLWRQRRNTDTVYFRDHLILPVILFAKYILGKKIIYESHYILTKRFGQWLTERSASVSDGVVAIAVALKDFYLRFNKNIIVSFCASSDKEKFKTDFSSSHFKKKVGLNENGFHLVYTGNIDVTGNGDSYGVEDIVHALSYMPKDVCFVVVGKKADGKHSLENLAESFGLSDRFKCIPWVSRDKVVDYILSSDILVIPKSGAKPGNSPTKMFEYLATRRPIVAADTLPMREVLHDKINASLVDYPNPQALSGAVNYIREHPEYKEKIVLQAMKDADLYTWEARAKAISTFIKKFYA